MPSSRSAPRCSSSGSGTSEERALRPFREPSKGAPISRRSAWEKSVTSIRPRLHGIAATSGHNPK